ncbi:MAG: peptidoglycan DD-metalloendopeptidase family protein [Defluviitaleaceae bacterium]|nr:peptidoglycan DD-metalloendopeptidase family protein [Defluviitaleaceae bacterium]
MQFWKKSQASRPAIKKASELINKNSHKQMKYISIMIVPSNAVESVKSLRMPRTVFHGIAIAIFVIVLTIAGLFLRSHYFVHVISQFYEELSEARDAFDEFQMVFAQEEAELLGTVAELSEQLNEEQALAQQEVNHQLLRQQYELGDIWAHINYLENMLDNLESTRQETIARLRTRTFIPGVEDILPALEAAQYALIELHTSEPIVAAGLMSLIEHSEISLETVIHRIAILNDELYVQRILHDSIESHLESIDIYLRNFPTLFPIKGGVITSPFGFRNDPFDGSIRHHYGVDVPAPTGTPIMAGGGGIVTYVGWRNGFGNVVFIDHGIGIVTLYAHNTVNLVYVGQEVSRGDVIAYVGSTGRASTPHLHYEVHVNGKPVNPINFFFEGN